MFPDTKLSVAYSQNIEVTNTSVSGNANFELRVTRHEIIAYLQSGHTVHQCNWDTHLIRMRIRGYCTTRMAAPNSRYKYKRNASYWWLEGRWRCSTSISVFLPGLQFFFGHFLKLVIFKASERKRSQVNPTYTKVYRQKTWQHFSLKHDAKRACVRAELYHKDESSKLSLLV